MTMAKVTTSERGRDDDVLSRSFTRSGAELTQRVSIGERTWTATVEAADSGDDLGDWWRAYLSGRSPATSRRHKSLTVVELFSGAGGLALGFSQAAAEL